MKKITLWAMAALAVGLSLSAEGQNLKRRPFLGVQILPVTDSLASAYKMKAPTGGMVAAVIPNSTAAALKLQPNDVIVKINDTNIQTSSDVVAKARTFTTGQPVTVNIIRNGKTLTLKEKVKEMPRETDPNAEVIYDEVKTENGYTRLIAKKPKGKGKYPAVFFIQGYGCGSIDNLPPYDPQRKLMDGLVEKGYAVFKMDKPGSGDSQGSAPCTEIAYAEELAAFSAGLKKLKTYDFVDAENVFLFGHSLGGNTAPIIASESKVKGIVVYGVAGKPWYEYMQDVFREQRAVVGTDPVQIDEDMKVLAPLTYEFMIQKKSPEELAKNPAYKPYLEQSFDYDGKGHVFGRHYTFMQGIQEAPLNKAWRDANTNSLVIYGEADIASISPHNSQLLTDAINTMHPGSATYKFLLGTDHGFIKVGTKQDLLRLQQSGKFGAYMRDNFNPALVNMVDSWMKQTVNNKAVGSK
ncbi:alpha/beta hydrolase family protein [Pontibacter cellulosilyticus]|uniref:Alpha/beta fold hydrolase n=1 Tax=Pontibacter cellulosilyticus TaxID=1720253 RepID=A0A923N3N3_9BACT|nr:alpha/beta fold hydrolase [Pontibacter cellulosilyticus]MBC5991274.1 alpha/beta fold hydrolase [Pontibacter cellulosilyticus]